VNELPPTTKKYVETFLVRNNVPFKLHKPVIGSTFVFLIDNDLVKFLIHNAATGEHMWGDESFDNIDNNEALAHLLGPRFGDKGGTIKKLFDKIDKHIDMSDNYKNN
jgi:hypothetical protein